MKKASLNFAIDRDRNRDADFDSNGVTAEHYGVRRFPTLVIVDRRGNVAFHSGGVDTEEGVDAMTALGKSMGVELDKSKMTEADAHRLWKAFFDREIAKVLDRP
jgi:hypothetical protein